MDLEDVMNARSTASTLSEEEEERKLNTIVIVDDDDDDENDDEEKKVPYDIFLRYKKSLPKPAIDVSSNDDSPKNRYFRFAKELVIRLPSTKDIRLNNQVIDEVFQSIKDGKVEYVFKYKSKHEFDVCYLCFNRSHLRDHELDSMKKVVQRMMKDNLRPFPEVFSNFGKSVFTMNREMLHNQQFPNMYVNNNNIIVL